MINMNYNYHTHTYRCHHASGTPEEYIKRAVECGVKYMGFSDHMPYVCSNGEESKYRMPVAEAKDYISEITELKEKYKNEIDIKIGFEMEYYCGFFDKMLENAISYGGEYLILGAHFTEEERPNGRYVILGSDDIEELGKYVDCVVAGIKRDVFTYVAHPDIINFTGDGEIYREEMRKICVASREHNIPLEINFLGIRDGRNYPNEKFWQVAGEEKSPVTFGFDAHDVPSAFDEKSLEKASALVEKYSLNYICKPEIIDIRKAVV